MAYLASSVWPYINSAALDLDRPLKKLNQGPMCFIPVSNPILAYFVLATMSAAALVFFI